MNEQEHKNHNEFILNQFDANVGNDEEAGNKHPYPQRRVMLGAAMIGISLVVLFTFGIALSIGIFAPTPYRYFCAVPIYVFCIFGIGESAFEALVPSLMATLLILLLT